MSTSNNVIDFSQKINSRDDVPDTKAFGYTQTSNDIQDALCRLSISGATFQILNTIIRQTFGWQKQSDSLTNTRFVEITGLSDRAVRKALDELVNRNVISYVKRGHSKHITINKNTSSWLFVQSEIRHEKAVNPAQMCQINSAQTCRKFGTNEPEIRHVCADTKEKRKNKDLPIVPLKFADEIKAIFEHWKNAMGKPQAKLTDERKVKIQARLQDGYSVEKIIRAIDGCAASDFHMGRKPGSPTQHCDFDLICRNGSKLEQFAAMPLRATSRDWSADILKDSEVLF